MKDESPGRRAASYWFIDGLPDIVLGLTLFVFGATGFLWRIYAPHPWAYDLCLMFTGFLLFFWKGRGIVDFLKSRVTYPRTGYAQPPAESERPDTLTILSLRMLVLAVTLYAVNRKGSVRSRGGRHSFWRLRHWCLCGSRCRRCFSRCCRCCWSAGGWPGRAPARWSDTCGRTHERHAPPASGTLPTGSSDP